MLVEVVGDSKCDPIGLIWNIVIGQFLLKFIAFSGRNDYSYKESGTVLGHISPAENNATFADFQKYYTDDAGNKGREIRYTLEATPTNPGELDEYSIAYHNYTVILSHRKDTVSRSVHVEWQDSNNQDGKRPASMAVQLYTDNVPLEGKVVLLSNANNWTHTWDDLTKYADGGREVTYSARVSSTLVDYTAKSTGMTIEMTYVPSSTSISAFVTWTDEKDADGLRPDYVTAQLMADGKPTGDSQVLSATSGWTVNWTGYPIYKDGDRIEYTFQVDVPDGYEANYHGVYDTSGLSAVLTHQRLKQELTGNIVWEDRDNQSGGRMGSVAVLLYADGSVIDEDDKVWISAEDGWEHTFSDLPVYRDGGQEIKYSMVLVSDPGKYVATTSKMTITMNLEPEFVDVPFEVIWNDNNNSDGVRPNDVRAVLLVDGQPSEKAQIITAKTDWTTTFTHLDYSGPSGVYRYRVELDEIPEGYIAKKADNVVVLKRVAETKDVTATVTWHDNNNQYRERPEQITLTLYADRLDGNGPQNTGRIVKCKGMDGWTYIFEGVPAFYQGKNIIYSVEASGDLPNYTASYLYYDRRVTDVSFDSMGGSDVGLAMRLYYGGTFAFVPAAPAMTGYTFTGWYTGTGDTARKVEPGTPINAINPDGLTALTLYAHWVPNTYDLVFETHGGVLSAPKRVTYDESVGELPTAALRGYIFQGWYDADGKLGVPEGNLITADTVVTTDTIIQIKNGVESPKTLYAWYEPVQIDLTFDAGAGKLDGDNTLTATYDKALGELPVPTREGYTFKAWHLSSVDGQVMTADTICKLIEDATLYAEYTPNLYVVKLDVNGGGALDKPTFVGTFDAPYGQLPTPSRVGHTFLGWFNDKGEQITADAILTTAAGHTLTAHWQANSYTVTLHAGEGAELEGAATRTVTYGQPYGELPSPQRNGYVFSGWYTEEKSGLLIKADTILTTPATHTLYAHWRVRSSGGGGSYTPPTNTLTFDTDSGAKIPPVEGTPNTTVDLEPYKPSRPGYTFVGWSDGKDIVTSVKLKGNITLKALWEKADRLGTFLEKEKHSAYLVGFADNTVRPNDTISRAEVAQILYRLMTVDAHMAYDTEKNAYTDVTADAWYNIPVSTLTAMGILKGRASDTFDPAAPISRAEFAAIMARFHGGKFEGENPFADTADCWAREDIGLVSGLGWMAGVGGNNFAPMRPMTRAEAVAVLNRALGRCPETAEDILPGAKTFPDNADETAWFYLDIQEAINGHSYTKDKDGKESWIEIK